MEVWDLNQSANRVARGCRKITGVRLILYEKPKFLTDIQGSSNHTDVLFDEPLIAQVVHAV